MPMTTGPKTHTEEERRALAPWAADCVERVLPLFEREARDDDRPRQAIEGLRAFARGERRVGELRSLAFDAHAAARAVRGPAAVAAARSAGQAAGVAHMAGHALVAAAYAATAATMDATDAGAALDAEVRWQHDIASNAVRATLRTLPARGRTSGDSPDATAILLDLLERER